MLEGLKVLDFSRYLPGPFASLRLAAWGAEVLKIEAKPSGDPARNMEPFFEQTGALFLANHLGKKSLFVDLKQQQGVELIHQLFAQADVVLESYRPGVAEKIGIGYRQAKAINPQIVYCSLSGYGQTGTMHQMGGHDINYLAVSGILHGITGRSKAPSVPDITVADLAGGMAATEAILAAYIQRLKTGRGSYLDISLVDALFSWQGTNAMFSLAAGEATSLGQKLREAVSYQVYETKDGRFVALGALEAKFWSNFCHAVGKEEWIPYHEAPAVAGEPIYEAVQSLFRSENFAYWSQVASTVDACLTPVYTLAEAMDSPLPKERGLLGHARLQEHLLQVVRAVASQDAGEVKIAVGEEDSGQLLRQWLGSEMAAPYAGKQKDRV